ncbi:MAG: hypothetical protein HGA67_04235 [Candidatus Yonathbacteria bacterium]|nr:hypothetical protein [Candidatus Yonathbacteria bacterium]
MLLQTWSEVLTQSFQELWLGVVAFVPNIIVAVIIFIIGWVIGTVIGKLIAQVIRTIKVDRALESAGAGEVLSKAGFKLDSGAFLGGLVKWFIIVASLVAVFDVLGLYQVNLFLQTVVLAYLPNVIVAALIILVAAVIADATQKVVTGSAKAADMEHAYLLGGMTRWAIWIFAIIIALDHLGIAAFYMQTIFVGVIVMLSLAGGLAFGLGGKDAADRVIEKVRKEITG